MSRVSRRAFLLTTGAAAALVSGSARADEVDDALRDLTAARAKVETLIAPLTQERVLTLLSSSVTSHGELTLVRPDRLRWDLKPPDEATYWVGPEGIAYRTPHGSGKVGAGSAGALGAVLDDLLVVLGGDLTKLRARHSVVAERRAGGVIVLTLTPKSDKVAKLVRRLTVEFTPDLLAARRVELAEPGDDRTTITFDTPKINAPVDAQRMKPP